MVCCKPYATLVSLLLLSDTSVEGNHKDDNISFDAESSGDAGLDYNNMPTSGAYEGGSIMGGDEYTDLIEVVGSNNKLTNVAYGLQQTISEIKYYISISKIRDNLKFSRRFGT